MQRRLVCLLLWLLAAQTKQEGGVTEPSAESRECICRDDIQDCSSQNRAAFFNLPNSCDSATKLNLSNNSFTSLKLSFDVLKKEFSEIYVTHGNGLQEIELAATNVKKLDVSSCVNLGTLKLTSEISIETLYANYNNLQELPIPSSQCNLRTLEMRNNRVQKINELTRCEHLTRFVASNNMISTLPHDFSKLAHLEVLDLSHNPLSSLGESLRHLRNLTLLNVSSSGLASLGKGHLEGLVSLRTLDLSANKLEALSEGVFSTLINLLHLNLSLNTIKSVPDGLFQNMTALSQLDLFRNNIAALSEKTFSGLRSLQYVNLSTNALVSIGEGSFLGSPALSVVDISNNQLVSFPFPLLYDGGDSAAAVPGNAQVATVRLEGNPLDGAAGRLGELLRGCSVTCRGPGRSAAACRCVDAACDHGRRRRLLFCVENPEVDGLLWLDAATSTTSTTPRTTTADAATSFTSTSSENSTAEEGSRKICSGNTECLARMNETKTNIHGAFSGFFLTPLQYSFLGFLLMTLVVLIIVNIIVGDPVVNDRWWEEKVPCDRPVT